MAAPGAHGGPGANGVAAAQQPLYSFAASQDGDDPAPPDFSFLEFNSQNPSAAGTAAGLGEFDYADFSATGSQSQSQSQAGASQTPLAFEETFEDGLQRQADQPRQLPEHACKYEPSTRSF